MEPFFLVNTWGRKTAATKVCLKSILIRLDSPQKCGLKFAKKVQFEEHLLQFFLHSSDSFEGTALEKKSDSFFLAFEANHFIPTLVVALFFNFMARTSGTFCFQM